MSGSWDVGSGSGSTGGSWDTPDSSRTSLAGPRAVEQPSLPEISSAPLHWLLLGIAAAVVGLVIPLFTDSHRLAIIGWLLGGTVSILLLATYLHFDLTRRSEGLSRDSAFAPWLRRLLLVLAAGAVTLNAWTIADAVARNSW
jgi:hypothetical protein